MQDNGLDDGNMAFDCERGCDDIFSAGCTRIFEGGGAAGYMSTYGLSST